MKLFHKLCYYCGKWVWRWNAEETYLPSASYPVFIWVCHECKPRWEEHERKSMIRFRRSLLPPDNGYMPQEAKDWIEGK